MSAPRRDWLPETVAATHCITSYPVGTACSVPTFRLLAGRRGSHKGWDPSTKRLLPLPTGGTVIHPSRACLRLPPRGHACVRQEVDQPVITAPSGTNPVLR